MKQFEDDAREEEQREASPEELAAFVNSSNRLVELAEKKADLEAELKEVNIEMSSLEYSVIPQMMEPLKLQEFPLAGAVKIVCKPEVKGNIPTPNQIEKAAKKDEEEAHSMEQRRIKALSWLNQNGHESIIKNNLTVDLGKDAGNKIAQICDLVVELGFEYDVGESVNAQTLNALIRELVKKGETPPQETFNIVNASRAQIKKK